MENLKRDPAGVIVCDNLSSDNAKIKINCVKTTEKPDADR